MKQREKITKGQAVYLGNDCRWHVLESGSPFILIDAMGVALKANPVKFSDVALDPPFNPGFQALPGMYHSYSVTPAVARKAVRKIS